MKNYMIVLLFGLSLLFQACATIPDSASSIDEKFPPALVELNFDSYGKRLNGFLYQANGSGPHPTVILLHGYPGNEKSLDLAQEMRRAGYNVLFFHYRGAWGSAGDFSFSNVIEDVGSAIAFLRSSPEEYRVDAERLLLIGHSLGGFAAIQGAARDKEIKCVAGMAASNTGLLADAVAANEELATFFAGITDNLTMLDGWSGQAALDDLTSNADAFDIAALGPALSGKSVLLVAADKDRVLATQLHHTPTVEAYLAQGDIDVTNVIIPGDHSFSWSRLELIDTVLSWAQNCEGAL